MDSVEGDPGAAKPSLADVADLPLKDLVTGEDSVLDQAMRTVIMDLDGRDVIYTGFGNTAG